MSWKEILPKERGKPYFQVLRAFVEDERKNYPVYPPASDTFNAFRITTYERANVVILGQDPYHGPGQAHGLSFSVLPGITVPPSLRNIYKELATDVGFAPPPHGHLLSWAQQGVLLLNSTLTVRAGKPGSHKGYGWERFTDCILEALNERETPVVFVLWGKTAQEKKDLLSNPRHFVIESPHPSPMSAYAGFFGSRPFSRNQPIPGKIRAATHKLAARVKPEIHLLFFLGDEQIGGGVREEAPRAIEGVWDSVPIQGAGAGHFTYPIHYELPDSYFRARVRGSLLSLAFD